MSNELVKVSAVSGRVHRRIGVAAGVGRAAVLDAGTRQDEGKAAAERLVSRFLGIGRVPVTPSK